MPMSMPQAAFAVALTAVRDIGPRRLARILRAGPPSRGWELVLNGALPREVLRCAPEMLEKLREGLAISARAVCIEELWTTTMRLGDVVIVGDANYPQVLAADIAPPPVLFYRGTLEALAHRRVTIVGTRNATALGRTVAAELGAALAVAGVSTVSGLALGIDGAAHTGALSVPDGAPPIAVVGSGLDRPFPPRHRGLWEEVAHAGLLMTEAPPGAVAEPWRFPQRNRILAALGELTVVVESRRGGGSMLTVTETIERGKSVLAVPGSVRNPASEGPNTLLYEGCGVVRDGRDLLMALGFERGLIMGTRGARDEPDGFSAELLAVLSAGPSDVEGLCEATGRTIAEVAMALGALEANGWVASDRGWFELSR